MAEKKTLLKFYIKQEELIRLVLYKFRDVKSFCKILHISRTRFYQYTNPKTTHRIYANGPDHLLWKMADLLGLEGKELNKVTLWESGKKKEE